MDKRKETINSEVDRLLKALKQTSVTSEEYGNLLKNLQTLLFIEWDYTNGRTQTSQDEPDQPVAPAPKTLTPVEQEAPVLVEPPQDPVVFKSIDDPLDFAKVRAICANSSKVLRPIIEKYVPEGKAPKLSNVPESAYRDLVKEIMSDAE